MSGVNKAILVGYLGADPELRYTQSGAPVANFSVATNEAWTDKQGQKQERTEWHRIIAWNKLAEICDQYLKKGRQVYVEGKIQTRQWEDRDGAKRYTTEILAREVHFLGGASSGETGRQGGYQPGGGYPVTASPQQSYSPQGGSQPGGGYQPAAAPSQGYPPQGGSATAAPADSMGGPPPLDDDNLPF